MAYTWTNGETITAEKLNSHGGVFWIPVTSTQEEDNPDTEAVENKIIYATSVTYQELEEAVAAGLFPIMRVKSSDSDNYTYYFGFKYMAADGNYPAVYRFIDPHDRATLAYSSDGEITS